MAEHFEDHLSSLFAQPAPGIDGQAMSLAALDAIDTQDRRRSMAVGFAAVAGTGLVGASIAGALGGAEAAVNAVALTLNQAAQGGWLTLAAVVLVVMAAGSVAAVRAAQSL